MSHTATVEEPPRTSADPSGPPVYESLARQFRPIFERIAKDAVHREQTRELPFEAVGWLRDAGFGAVRIPRSHGGLGASLPQLFRLLVELGEADSNISHLFRGHFTFLEARLNDPELAAQEFWFPKVVGGVLIGYAMAERSEGTGGTATLTKEGDHWIIDGTKYYSTGTIYADWIVVAVLEQDERVSVAVPVTAAGVTRLDDWDGFGQRLTGSGTTKFDRVRVEKGSIIRRFSAADLNTQSYQKAFLQLVLLASLAGIGRAVLRDAIAFVQPRTRAFGVPGKSSPRQDPLVQRVVGRLASLAFAAETIVDGVAGELESLSQAARDGGANEAAYVATEIKAFQAQQIVIDLVLNATTLLFEVGGASATSETRRLDRHWRNARTAASHNPAIHRERAIGDYYLNGTIPDGPWRDALNKKREAKAQPDLTPGAPTEPAETSNGGS
jgi:alkylation response protein AidB-like acyl-CoA dehydrogenase